MSETTRTYEFGYLIVPTVADAQIEATVQNLNTAITGAGATVVATGGTPEFIDLAYTMEKTVASKIYRYNQGYFGWIKFDADPEMIEALKKAFDANAEIIRYLLVKTSAQNTVIFKKPKIEAKRETESALDEEIIADDLALDHEKLPDLEGDILDETPAVQAAAEETEA